MVKHSKNSKHAKKRKALNATKRDKKASDEEIDLFGDENLHRRSLLDKTGRKWSHDPISFVKQENSLLRNKVKEENDSSDEAPELVGTDDATILNKNYENTEQQTIDGDEDVEMSESGDSAGSDESEEDDSESESSSEESDGEFHDVHSANNAAGGFDDCGSAFDLDELEEFDVEVPDSLLDIPRALQSEPTHRLALTRFDWQNNPDLRLVHTLVRSFLDAGAAQRLLRLVKFPSKFYLSRREEEARHGPIEFRGHQHDHNDVAQNSEQDDVTRQPMSANRLARRHHLAQLRYFLAVLEFDSVATATHIRAELDGWQLERSGVALELVFVPDDWKFSDGESAAAAGDNATTTVTTTRINNIISHNELVDELPLPAVASHHLDKQQQHAAATKEWEEAALQLRSQENAATSHMRVALKWDETPRERREWEQNAFQMRLTDSESGSGNDDVTSRKRRRNGDKQRQREVLKRFVRTGDAMSDSDVTGAEDGEEEEDENVASFASKRRKIFVNKALPKRPKKMSRLEARRLLLGEETQKENNKQKEEDEEEYEEDDYDEKLHHQDRERENDDEEGDEDEDNVRDAEQCRRMMQEFEAIRDSADEAEDERDEEDEEEIADIDDHRGDEEGDEEQEDEDGEETVHSSKQRDTQKTKLRKMMRKRRQRELVREKRTKRRAELDTMREAFLQSAAWDSRWDAYLAGDTAGKGGERDAACLRLQLSSTERDYETAGETFIEFIRRRGQILHENS